MSSRSHTYAWEPGSGQRSSLSLGLRVIIGLAFILFVAGGLLFGYLFYSNMRQGMDSPLNPVEGVAPVLPNSATARAATPVPGTPSTTSSNPVASSGAVRDRVNILLLGIDQRESEANQPTRTDTMILVTVDPVGKTMGMLSIPRDLWVAIPGLSKPLDERINAAHFYGDLNKYPGGGVALAKRTVQYNLGVPVHYYVRLDFKGFEKIVDAMGGVTINVEKAIRDDQYPDGEFGVMSMYIPAGLQHMDGQTALRYVRTRHVDSDFGRNRRQITFLRAMRDQALKLNIVPKLPGLISQLRDSVKTDLSANEIIALARIATQIDNDHITEASIDESMVTPWITPQGGDVLIPRRDKIREVVDRMFGTVAGATPTPQQPAAAAAPTAKAVTEEMARLQAEGARIEVLNGTVTKGLAGRARTYLAGLGYNVVLIGDAGRYDYNETVIVYYSEKRHAQSGLIKLFNVRAENVRLAPSARSDVDIRVILGSLAQVP